MEARWTPRSLRSWSPGFVFRVEVAWCIIWRVGFGDQGSWFGGRGVGFSIEILGFGVLGGWGLGLRVEGLGIRVEGLEFGFRV